MFFPPSIYLVAYIIAGSSQWPEKCCTYVIAGSNGRLCILISQHEEALTGVSQGFVKWSPLRVWEEERLSSSRPSSTSSSLLDISLPDILHHQHLGRSHDLHGHTPSIATLSLPSITNCSSKAPDRHAVEVLGPLEHVPGQPIRTKLEISMSHPPGSRNATTKARVLTMLYRRYTC